MPPKFQSYSTTKKIPLVICLNFSTPLVATSFQVIFALFCLLFAFIYLLSIIEQNYPLAVFLYLFTNFMHIITLTSIYFLPQSTFFLIKAEDLCSEITHAGVWKIVCSSGD